jgi:hypothetical protein
MTRERERERIIFITHRWTQWTIIDDILPSTLPSPGRDSDDQSRREDCMKHCHALYVGQYILPFPYIIIEGQFQNFQRFSSSKLVLITVESCFVALNYYGNGSTYKSHITVSNHRPINTHIHTMHTCIHAYMLHEAHIHLFSLCLMLNCIYIHTHIHACTYTCIYPVLWSSHTFQYTYLSQIVILTQPYPPRGIRDHGVECIWREAPARE